MLMQRVVETVTRTVYVLTAVFYLAWRRRAAARMSRPQATSTPVENG